jgi:hypothetical protein
MPLVLMPLVALLPLVLLPPKPCTSRTTTSLVVVFSMQRFALTAMMMRALAQDDPRFCSSSTDKQSDGCRSAW